jgi:hypothetical protein
MLDPRIWVTIIGACSFEYRTRSAATLTADPAGGSPAGGNYPVATAVISDNGEGDRSAESSEVKVSGREASNSAGRSNGEPVSPEIL